MCDLSAPMPHPKAILGSMLESLEEKCRKDLSIDRKYIIEKIEADIKSQRDPQTRKPKGLEINYVKLSDARIRLGEVRQKLQYLESSIASLEETNGLPGPCMRWEPWCPKTKAWIKARTPEEKLAHKWMHPLREVKVRLSNLKAKCQQHKINIENLQERVQGILCIVRLLILSPRFLLLILSRSPSSSQKRKMSIVDNQTSNASAEQNSRCRCLSSRD